MKYDIRKINPVNGSEAIVQRDSINGDYLVVAQGDKAVVIQIKDIVSYVVEQEAKQSQSEPIED
jgi:hypothetical protein